MRRADKDVGTLWRTKMRWLTVWLRMRRMKREREIFRFWDGKKTRAADPLEIWLALKNDPEFNYDTTPGFVDAGDTEAIKVTIGAIRRIFGVKTLEQGGLTSQECLELLAVYFLYEESLKKSTSEPATPQSPTGSESSDKSTTPPDLGSSSIPNVPSLDTPLASLPA